MPPRLLARAASSLKSPMAICVSNGYTGSMSKDSGLRIRVERELRDEFLSLCHEQDRPAAQVIREFMRRYLATHQRENDEAGKRPPTKKAGKRT